jgi:hypothetical protein
VKPLTIWKRTDQHRREREQIGRATYVLETDGSAQERVIRRDALLAGDDSWVSAG